MKEGEFITTDQLRNEWAKVLSTYDLFIKGGHKLRPIRFIVRYIIEKGYDKLLFPGTSMYSLLISLPLENKVNYDKTLRVDLDQLSEKLRFRFYDWTGVDRENEDLKNQIKWEKTCQLTEGDTILENFFTDNGYFKKSYRQKNQKLIY